MADRRKFSEGEKLRGEVTIWAVVLVVAVTVWLTAGFPAAAITFGVLGLLAVLVISAGSKDQPTSSDE